MEKEGVALLFCLKWLLLFFNQKNRGMKKIGILLLSTFLFTAVGYAQSPVHFGVKLGANYSTLETDVSGFSSKYAAGFLGGVFARVDLPKKLVLQPELYYSLKRGEIEAPSVFGVGGGTTEMEKGDLDAALLLGYRLVDLELFNFRLMGGVVNSFNMNDNLSGGDFEKSSLGYQAGVGVDLANITVDVRYEGSFGEVTNGIKYKGVQLALGFKFI
jgi:hypothetical protein